MSALRPLPVNAIVACPSLVLPPLLNFTLSPSSPVQLIVSMPPWASLLSFSIGRRTHSHPRHGYQGHCTFLSISTYVVLLWGKRVVHRSSFLVHSSESLHTAQQVFCHYCWYIHNHAYPSFFLTNVIRSNFSIRSPATNSISCWGVVRMASSNWS